VGNIVGSLNREGYNAEPYAYIERLAEKVNKKVNESGNKNKLAICKLIKLPGKVNDDECVCRQ
jgi:hypothetical protein